MLAQVRTLTFILYLFFLLIVRLLATVSAFHYKCGLSH